jgi:hypothetical protein
MPNVSPNYKVVVAPSLARTVTGNSGVLQNWTLSRGLVLILDITAASGTTPTLDVKVQRLDAVSGKAIDIPGAAFAQKTTTGTDSLVIYPGNTVTANRSISDTIGDDYQVVWTVAGTTPSFTFSIGGTLLP